MKRVSLAILFMAAGAFPIQAQRLDGCPTRVANFSSVGVPYGRRVDEGLREAGIILTKETVTVALKDSRADVRSLAALKLAEWGARSDLDGLVQAWTAEKDSCAKSLMESGLSTLLRDFALDSSQHPGGQPWIMPFQPCTSTGSPEVTVTLEQITEPQMTPGPAVRISFHNETSQTIPFVGVSSPEQLFSVSVLDPNGEHARVAKEVKGLFEPVNSNAYILNEQLPSFLPLPSGGSVSRTWLVGKTFDMSSPGTYRVRLGGRIGYLGTTVCSNTAEVTIGK